MMDEPATTAAARPGAMTVVHGIDALDRSLGRLFVVIGVFDGLHLGHQYLLRRLVKEAGRLSARPAVLTFDHHPDEVLTGAAPPLLLDPTERLARLEQAGVAVTIVQTFDVALRETPYDAFIRRIAEHVALAGFLMTPESAFGFQRRGTPDAVAALGRELGYEVVVVPPYTLQGEPVRSTDIRAAIESGDLARAQRLLGRRVSVVGRVTRALRAATTLAFEMPVALPPPGRYEALVRTAAGAVRHRTVEVDGRQVQLVPAVPATTGSRLHVDLARSVREPRSAATIRRS